MSSLRVGLIGCGGMGMNLARHCHSLENAKIVAVTDAVAEAAKKAADEFGARRFPSYKSLIEFDVDGVIIATPNDSHARYTIAAARAGKHIFCEKPMAMRVADCKAMIDAADKADVKLMVGQVLRLIPAFWKTHQIVSSGKLGKPFGMAVTRLGGPDGLSRGWRASKKQAGGVLYEVHVHELDFMRFVMGEAESVYASMGHFTEAKTEYEDVAFVQIRYRNGGIGTLHCGTSSSIGNYEMMVQCEKGTLVNGGFGGGIRYCKFREEPMVVDQSELEKEDAYHEEVRSWVDCITKGTPMVFDGHDGMKAIELCDAAYRSARTGKPVRLPLAG